MLIKLFNGVSILFNAANPNENKLSEKRELEICPVVKRTRKIMDINLKKTKILERRIKAAMPMMLKELEKGKTKIKTNRRSSIEIMILAKTFVKDGATTHFKGIQADKRPTKNLRLDKRRSGSIPLEVDGENALDGKPIIRYASATYKVKRSGMNEINMRITFDTNNLYDEAMAQAEDDTSEEEVSEIDSSDESDEETDDEVKNENLEPDEHHFNQEIKEEVKTDIDDEIVPIKQEMVDDNNNGLNIDEDYLNPGMIRKRSSTSKKILVEQNLIENAIRSIDGLKEYLNKDDDVVQDIEELPTDDEREKNI